MVANLGGDVVGRPSMLTPPPIGEAMKPLDRLEAAYDTAKKKRDAENEAFKPRRGSL